MTPSDVVEYKNLIDHFFSSFRGFLQNLPAVQYLFFNKILTLVIAIIGIAAFYFKASSELKKYRRVAREKNALNFEYQMAKDAAYKKATELTLGYFSPAIHQGVRQKLSNGAIYIRINKPLCFLFCKEVLKEKEKLVSATLILNRWEMCANGIRAGLLDEDYLYKIHATTVILIYDLMFIIIKSRQAVSPRAFITFEWLAKKWKIERLKSFSMEKDNQTIVGNIIKFDYLMKNKSRLRLWFIMMKMKLLAK
ncbi:MULTISPECIES: DUF4760 domain-containing protein [Enterobacterales]|uniref:DUF4760 domain-containing protein n=1 Tax=Enterobacterales TaxID=91347 RepID=UPI000DDC927C|nr:DUF4760 domain-containing protein [Escherichia coli]RBJ22269.1 hypothetical protein DSB62_25530 [Escherichia coli]